MRNTIAESAMTTRDAIIENPWQRAVLRAGVAGLLLILAAVGQAAEPAQRWLLVDTQQLTLTVMEGERPLLTLHNLAIGRFGVSREKQRGDNTTPLGVFRISRINRDASFHRFIGLDYPNEERARAGLYGGDINRDEYREILAAHRAGKAPPQDTVLGGHIGIHGLGEGDRLLHEATNWTKGCVAVSNEQIDTLLLWVRVGMRVEIR
jgi:murein L,D-transpeptidase YafK